MENVEIEVSKKGIATIVIDLNAKGKPSSSGKTILVASTGGNKSLKEYGFDTTMLGVNCYKYPQKK